MEEDRRRSPRIIKTLAVLYAHADQETPAWNITSVHNISDTGMRIITNEECAMDSILTFRIKFPTHPYEWQEIQGKIKGLEQLKTPNGELVAGQYIARVEFLEIPIKQRTLLEEYIVWFLQQSGGEHEL